MADKISCPNCGHQFDVEEALSGKLQAYFRAEFQKKVASNNEKLEQERAVLRKELDDFEKKKERANEMFKQKLNERIAKETEKIESQAKEGFEQQLKSLNEENERRKAENRLLKQQELDLLKRERELKEQKEELELNVQKKLQERIEKETEKIQKQAKENFEQQMKALREENAQRKAENRLLKQQELDLLKRENELKEQKEELEIDIKKQLLEGQKEIEQKGRMKEREEYFLKEKEYQKQLSDQKELIEEMRRKAEQGSEQLQGEVQELALEEILRTAFPFDEIEEVGKGLRGADCIQKVVNERQQGCGAIVYESKRTKTFSDDWIDKLKQDQIQCKADIAVIVTETMPKGMLRFDQMRGVWVCGFHEVNSVAAVLRQILIKAKSVKTADENKGEKMELLYHYLTSGEFVQTIKRIVENYDGMIQQLNSEKRAMQRIWKTREKQILGVQENISSLFGSIKGIAGRELETSSVLELPDKKFLR